MVSLTLNFLMTHQSGFKKLHIGSTTFDTPLLIFFEKRPLLAFHIEDYIFFLSENDNIFRLIIKSN